MAWVGRGLEASADTAGVQVAAQAYVRLPPLLPPCYLSRMSSQKKQTQLRLEPGVLAAGKDAAAARGLDFNRYVERLIAEDTSGARAAGMASAQRLLDEHGSFLDGLEKDLDTRHSPAPSRGAAA